MTYKLMEAPIPRELVGAVKSLDLVKAGPRAGHGGTDYDQGWIGDLANTRIPVDELGFVPGLAEPISLLTARLRGWTVTQVMVNRLGPDSRLALHRDGFSYAYRFHLPIITNEFVFWWDEIQHDWEHFEMGFWYGPVPYSGVLHTIVNGGAEPRYHIVADLEGLK